VGLGSLGFAAVLYRLISRELMTDIVMFEE